MCREVESSDEDDDDVLLAVLRLSKGIFDCDFNELVKIDDCIATQCNSSVNSAVDSLAYLRDGDIDDDGDCDADDCINEHEQTVTLCEAQECIDKLKGFALGKGQNTILDSVMTLQELFTNCRTEVSTRQSKISDFFK